MRAQAMADGKEGGAEPVATNAGTGVAGLTAGGLIGAIAGWIGNSGLAAFMQGLHGPFILLLLLATLLALAFWIYKPTNPDITANLRYMVFGLLGLCLITLMALIASNFRDAGKPVRITFSPAFSADSLVKLTPPSIKQRLRNGTSEPLAFTADMAEVVFDPAKVDSIDTNVDKLHTQFALMQQQQAEMARKLQEKDAMIASLQGRTGGGHAEASAVSMANADTLSADVEGQ
jgi:hypothetical protein